MRLLRRLLIFILISLTAILVFVPPLIGLGVKKYLNESMFYSDRDGGIQTTVTSYHRGWFRSDIVVRVELNNPNLRYMLKSLGIAPNIIPEPITFTINASVLHGPLFYSSAKDLPKQYGLLLISNKINFPANQKAFFNAIGLHNGFIIRNQTYYDFFGKHFKWLETDEYNLFIPEGEVKIHFDSIQGRFVYDSSTEVKGWVALNDLSIEDGYSTRVFSPRSMLIFNAIKEKSGYWLGGQSLIIPLITISNIAKQLMRINDLSFNSSISPDRKYLDIMGQLTLRQVDLEDNQIGPYNLQFNMDNLNPAAIVDLVSTYRNININGEKFPTQFNSIMLSIIPKMVDTSSSFQIKTYASFIPAGRLKFLAKINWPQANTTSTTIENLMDSSHVTAYLRVTALLANRLTGPIAKLIYMYQIPEDKADQMANLKEWNTYIKENNVSLISTVFSKPEDKVEKNYLIALIYDPATIATYNAELKKLVLSKKISRETAYHLGWQYAVYRNQQDDLNEYIGNYQQQVNIELNKELSDLLKENYIIKDQEDYLIDVIKKANTVLINGKVK
jgi:hypothetical protein